MRWKLLAPVFALLVLAAACGGETGATAPDTESVAATAAPSSGAATTEAPTTDPSGAVGSTAQPADSASSVATSPPATEAPAGPPAPDFDLALGNGETFRLSDEAQPVYMVFWAEW